MSRIENCFQKLHRENKKALISYITAGDPHPSRTLEIMHALVEAGSDLIELGVPFSDPMADGPVIQAACERSLKHGTSLEDVLTIVKEFRLTNADTPVILMGYENPMEIFGVEKFAKIAKNIIDGVITVDLPPEESKEIASTYKSEGIDTIYLMAPTTNSKRIQTIAKLASGFLYYVSFKGITGANKIDGASVANKISEIKQHTNLPVAVGFGVKDAATAAMVADSADAVVVGSAIVSIIAEYGDDVPNAMKKVKSLLQEIKNALDNSQGIQNIA